MHGSSECAANDVSTFSNRTTSSNCCERLTQTMSLAPNVRGNIIWYGLPRVASRAAALLLLPLYTRVLSPGELGLAMVALAAGGLLNLVVAPGAERLYLHWAFGPNSTHFPSRSVFGSISILHIVFLTSSIVLLATWAEPISVLLLHGVETFPFYYIILGTAGLISLSTPLRATWRAQHRADKLAAFEITLACISVATTLVGLLWFQAGAVSILLGDLVAYMVLLPLYLRKVVTGLLSGWSWQVGRAVLPEASVGLPLSLSGWVFAGFDRILLGGLAGPEEVGIYAAGYQIGAVVMLMSVILNKEWQPLIFSFGAQATEQTLQLQTLWHRSLALFLAVGSLLVFFSGRMVESLLESSYADCATIVPLVVTLAVTQVAHSFLVNVGIVSHNSATLLRESLLSVTLFLLASVLFIPDFGASGVAAAGLVARLVGCLYLFLSRWNPFSIDGYLVLNATVLISCVVSTRIQQEGIMELLLGSAIFVFAAYQTARYWIFLGTLNPAGVES